MLGARPISVRKTIVNLADAVRSLCNAWDIDIAKVQAIVTDNGASMVGAGKAVFIDKKHVRCFAHTLNLAIISAIGLYQRTEKDPWPEAEDSDDSESNDLLSTASSVDEDSTGC